MTARDNCDGDLRSAAPYGGSGGGGGSSGKIALESDPKVRLHIKASVKVLQVWLSGPDVAGPIVRTDAPVAAAFGVAPVAGVPNEQQSGAGALIAYYDELGDSSEVFRIALARRSIPLSHRSPRPSCSTSARRTRSSARSRVRAAPWRRTSPPSSPRSTTAPWRWSVAISGAQALTPS